MGKNWISFEDGNWIEILHTDFSRKLKKLNLSLKKVESQKSDSTGFYAISFEKKCKKYIYKLFSFFKINKFNLDNQFFLAK